MPSPAANPTPITPPREPLFNEQTGLINRSWYMFFLNLYRAANTVINDTDLAPNAESLIASYDAALRAVNQELQTLPPAIDYTEDIIKLRKESNLQPSAEVGELQQQIDTLRQEIQTQRQPELGSLAPLEQDNVPWLTFNTAPSPVPTAVGSMYWDGGTTMGVQATTDVLIRIGESEYVYAKASSAITKGQLCYHTGAVGASGVITVAPTPLALADPNQIVGVAAETIALNGFGLIQISGDLRGFNTTGSSVGETWADGDPLYYNPAYVGSFTKTKPSAPNQKTYIGEVTNAGSGGSGSIHIRLVPGSVLGGTDSNVQFGTLANGDLIQYDSTLQYWKNVPASTLPVGTATNLAGGAAGSVPYQSAPSTTTFLSIGTAGRWMGSSGTAPQWNAPAALTKTDDTNVTLTLGGSASTALLNAASLTLGWTGQLAVSRGGTGVSTATANTVFAGPTTGSAAAPSFRALVSGDIPALSYVSSVSATAPITSTGGLTPTIGVTSAALSKTDDTNVTLTLGGSPTTALLAATSLTLGWTGQLAVSRGGTGVSTTPANGQLLIGNGTGYTVANLTAGTGISVTNAGGSITITNTSPSSGGTVTSVSVVSANGFAGTVATSTTTPAITISTSITGLLYGNGTAIAAATVSSPLSYSAGTLSIPVATSSANGYLSSTDWTTFNNKQSTSAPVTYTANFSVATTDNWIINNKSGSSCTATLPAASSFSGRVLRFQNYQAQTLVSASSNVVPIGGGAAGTSILLASAGDQATLVSDGTNWIMMQYIPNNILLLE